MMIRLRIRLSYALLGSFVALAAAVGAITLGTNLNTWYNTVAGRATTMSGIAAS